MQSPFRLMHRLIWRDPHRRARKLLRFAETEADGGRDLVRAAERTADPLLRRLYLTHADDEQRHANLFRHRGIALLLSDLMMPRMGGKELAAKAREILPDMKIILMSGNPEDGRLSLGGVHLLSKPFSIHTLATVVRRALDNRASSGAAAGSLL